MSVLVVFLLTTESSYAQEVERPASGTPDTVQFWLGGEAQWRIRTFAIDHDIHLHTIGGSGLSAEKAVTSTMKSYGDIVASTIQLSVADLEDDAAIRNLLDSHGLTGSLEKAKQGFAFYNPDGGFYTSKSRPK